MRIYTVRDRLLNYFNTPLVAPNDQEILGSLASIINNGESTHAIAQAPHHFEIWCIAQIEDNHTVTPLQEFLGDAASLIRAGVRDRRTPGDQKSTETAPTRQGDLRGDIQPTRPHPSAITQKTPPEPLQAVQAHHQPGGVHRGGKRRGKRVKS